MTTTTTTLTDFLLARVREDQLRAREAHRDTCASLDERLPFPCNCGHPGRLLGECAAKRAIALTACHSGDWNSGLEILRHLAAVYSDHADYDPSWAVS